MHMSLILLALCLRKPNSISHLFSTAYAFAGNGWCLAQLYQGLQAALSPFAATYQALQQGAAWLRDIAYILEPTGPQPCKGEQVAEQLRGYLDTLRPRPDLTPALGAFGHHLDTVSRSYWPGLFHCYDVPGLPRTNNEIESRFRDTSRYLLRTTGQKGLT